MTILLQIQLLIISKSTPIKIPNSKWNLKFANKPMAVKDVPMKKEHVTSGMQGDTDTRGVWYQEHIILLVLCAPGDTNNSALQFLEFQDWLEPQIDVNILI